MIRTLLLGLFLMSALAAFAATADEAPAASKPATEKKICRKDVGTGTIMPRRICHTKAEWSEIEARAKSDLDYNRNMERPTDGR